MNRQRLNEIMRDPSTTYKLRSAIEQAQARDPLDALKDAEILHAACILLCEEAGCVIARRMVTA
jgi:hypothetical protein